MKVVNQKVAKWPKLVFFLLRTSKFEIALIYHNHETTAFNTEQCMTPLLSHNFKVS